MNLPGSRLRSLLDPGSPLVAPGTFNALFARMIEESGFGAVYLSGAGVANTLVGQPDLGMVSADEMAAVAERISDVIDVPLIVDGDTGYGGVHSIGRLIRRYEQIGVAAVQLEDQVFPKRCGHFDDKEVVSTTVMVQRLAAALASRTSADHMLIIARTDARGPLGLDEAIDRARLYGEAGADIVFVEAPRSEDEFRRIGSELSEWPQMANMVEFGKSPLMSAQRLGELGFSLVIYPGAIMRSSVWAAERVLAGLSERGSTEHMLDEMASFGEVNRIVGLDKANEWETEMARRAETPKGRS